MGTIPQEFFKAGRAKGFSTGELEAYAKAKGWLGLSEMGDPSTEQPTAQPTGPSGGAPMRPTPKTPEVVFVDDGGSRIGQGLGSLSAFAQYKGGKEGMIKGLSNIFKRSTSLAGKLGGWAAKRAGPIAMGATAAYQTAQDVNKGKLKQTGNYSSDAARAAGAFADNVSFGLLGKIPAVNEALYNTTEERTKIYNNEQELKKRGLGGIFKGRARRKMEDTVASDQGDQGQQMRERFMHHKKNDPSYGADDFNNMYVWSEKKGTYLVR